MNFIFWIFIDVNHSRTEECATSIKFITQSSITDIIPVVFLRILEISAKKIVPNLRFRGSIAVSQPLSACSQTIKLH